MTREPTPPQPPGSRPGLGMGCVPLGCPPGGRAYESERMFAKKPEARMARGFVNLAPGAGYGLRSLRLPAGRAGVRERTDVRQETRGQDGEARVQQPADR
jgi:hypothetical protein